MVVILVLATFAVFVTVDFLLQRKRRAALLREGEALQAAHGESEPRWVAGFRLPERLSYHRGHTWVRPINAEEAYVGLDDFARRLIGDEATLSVPGVGTHVAQGEDTVKVSVDGKASRLLSPISGEIVGVNPLLEKSSRVPFHDAFGRGWLFKIRSKRLGRELHNLMNGNLAVRWMEDTFQGFQHRLMLATGSVIQDGGTPIEDIAGALGPDEWKSLVDEFLSLENHEPV